MPKHSSLLYTFARNFLRCGITGWCMEIVFTALSSLRRRNFQLKGSTSLWMFPIYGCAALLQPLFRLLKDRPLWLRGTAYMSLIFSMEVLGGSLLRQQKLCPWDYGRSRYNIGRVIRLDYAPGWFIAGLLFERLLGRHELRDETP